MLPLIPLAMYGPAAIGAIGAAAKGLQRYGPQIRTGLQSATNLANRGLTGLQNVSQPYLKNIADKFMQSNPLSQALAVDTASRPTESLTAMGASALIKSLVGSAKFIKANEEEREQMLINAARYLNIDIDEALEQAGQELLEEEESKKIKEPEIPEKKKGGYVKKQRKRKHYRASGFVKMKKKKKYKKKYIKT